MINVCELICQMEEFFRTVPNFQGRSSHDDVINNPFSRTTSLRSTTSSILTAWTFSSGHWFLNDETVSELDGISADTKITSMPESAGSFDRLISLVCSGGFC